MNTRYYRLAMLLSIGVLGQACTGDKVEQLAVQGRTNANPSIAAAGQFVGVAWSAATTSSMDIFVATSNDGATTFSQPVRVNATAGEARVSGEQPPRIALVPHKGQTPEVVVVWTAKGPTGTLLLSARSVDGGHTFGASTTVPGSDGPGNRGWESVAVDSTGRVLVLWLDHRESAMPAAMHHQAPVAGAMAAMPAPKGDPNERAALSKLYFSSLDGSAALTITPSVCYCCKTSLVATGNNVYAVWRHVYPGTQRDIAFSQSHDDGATFSAPVRVSEDHWVIDGCPENGPTVAIDRLSRAHVVWPTPVDGQDVAKLGLFYAVSRDGVAFSRRSQIPTRGPSSHAQMVIEGSGSPIVAWDEVVNGSRRLGIARITADESGNPVFTPIPPPDEGAGRSYPVLASTTAGTVAAWVSQADKGSTIGVARVK
jgi:hypothetical protein